MPKLPRHNPIKMHAAAARPKGRPTLRRHSLRKTPAAALRPKLTAKLPKKVERKLSNSKLWLRLQRKSPSDKDKRRFAKKKKCAPGCWHNSIRYCRPAIRHED